MITAQPSPPAAHPDPAQPAPPDVRGAPPPVVRGEPAEVADGVFVVHDNRVPIVPNVGLDIGDQAALVIDTALGPGNSGHVLEQARRLAGSRPLYQKITHFHPEHRFGAHAFKGAATIIYHRAQRDEPLREGAGRVHVSCRRAACPAGPPRRPATGAR